jgi:two-component system chemotaxis sensor kinase CheA
VSFSIHHKLVVVSAALTVAVIGSLTLYLDDFALHGSAIAAGIIATTVGVITVGLIARSLAARLRDKARKEQERLERVVARRTRELDRRNGDLQLVFDNIEQGFFTIDRDGRMSAARSAAVETWLGAAPASGLLCDYVAAFDPDGAGWFEVNWQSVAHDLLPLDLALAQLPQRFVVGGRTLGFGYKPIWSSDGVARRILVVISDLTAAVARERAERDMRETTALLSRLISDRRACVELHDEAGALVAAIVGGAAEPRAIVRELHTLKGNAAAHGLGSIAELCHEMETTIATDGVVTAEHVEALEQRWQILSQAVSPLFACGADQGGIDGEEAVSARLQRFADQARELAVRLGKGPIDVQIECSAVRLPRAPWAGFWSVFGHAVRNAVDHGLEPGGRLVLRARRDADRFVVEIQDHGRGIDWERLAAAARAGGRAAATRADLIDAMFADQVTTRDVVTETSGRGVGMGVLRDTCRAMGGDVAVWSERGAGTRLRFEWPALRVSCPREPRSLPGAVPGDPRARPSLLRRSSADHC